MARAEELMNYIVILENLLAERDEWFSALTLYSIKKDTIDKYLEEDEDTISVKEELNDQISKAERLLQGAEQEVYLMTGIDSIEKNRDLLVELKTLLNLYTDKFSGEFIEREELQELDTEDLLRKARSLMEV